MYKFDIELNGRVICTKYSLRSAYECIISYTHLNEPLDLYICEYRGSRLYYSWTLDAFIKYCKKTFS